ncbi:hypothetical protein FHR81_004205 [Actinoalloteichus hoggarensis]|uniref:Uncharacterized protein n=1 Tax=Actinoalloteichus hoggarensis TaxID=1470176 RepID=A0A221W933_9PSEU|nr:hypothetical protein [Actinoalloteichus hoggarensis]ASO22438.1 hypothetical protein AHOG_24160 [Actinoalloteichus hoggarensis]MBB5923138.1 hypothetical protein [Actinoalloteichus hoggarensis]
MPESGIGGRTDAPGCAAEPADTAADHAELIAELRRRGVKISPRKVVRMTRLRDGRVAWLETGSTTAGLAHILEARKVRTFERAGVPREWIVTVVFAAVERGRLIGYHGVGRPVYEVETDAGVRRVSVDVSDNGFIVGAHPVSLRTKVRRHRDRTRTESP